MNETRANMSVWVGDNVVCIKIAGRASLHSSLEFKDVVHLLQDKGHARFVLDLTDCLLMDSTFLGVLARMGINAVDGQPRDTRLTVELLNPNERIRELLDTLGVTEYFQYLQGQCEHMDQLQPLETKPGVHDARELARTSLEAHETLMELNPENVPKFKDVTKFLAEELKSTDTASATKKSSPSS